MENIYRRSANEHKTLSVNGKISTFQKEKEIKKKRKVYFNNDKVHQGEALCHARCANIRTQKYYLSIKLKVQSKHSSNLCFNLFCSMF
jgi:hypothetical protein